MGDRCYLSMWWKKSDTEKLLAASRGVFGACSKPEDIFSDVEEDGEEIHGSRDEANYGWFEQLTAMAKAGLVFHGWHGPGGEYGEKVFLGFNGEYIEVDSVRQEPVVPVDDDGNPEVNPLAQVRHYVETMKKAQAYMKEEAHG